MILFLFPFSPVRELPYSSFAAGIAEISLTYEYSHSIAQNSRLRLRCLCEHVAAII